MARDSLMSAAGSAGRAGVGCGAQLGIVVAGLALAAVLFDKVRATFDPMERDARWAELDRAQRFADDMYGVNYAAGALLRFVPSLALAILLGGLSVVIVLMVYRRWATWEMLRAEKMIALRRAEVMRFPEGLQTLAFHDSSRDTAAPMLTSPAWGDEAGDAEAEEAERSATFAGLLEAGSVGRGRPLLLGYDLDDGQALTGSWSDLYSTATAGLPGTGKTTSQRFYACQTALHGARFVVCDPHASAGDDSLAATLSPLRSLFMVDPAEEPRHILEAVRYAASIGDARLKGRSSDRGPVILWVDELTSLLGRSDVGDDLAGALEQIAQEHRKVGVYLAASGQIWTAARIPTTLRDSLASVLCHRMKRGQARTLLPTEEAAMVERLGTGEAVLYRTSGATSRVRIPNTTAEDVVCVAGLLTGPPLGLARAATGATVALADASRPSRGRVADAPSDDAASALERPKAPRDAETARMLARFADGASVHELAAELAGSDNTGSRAYKVARGRVEALLRTLVPRGEQ